jgi:ADP-ribose pyrophosphatase
MQTYIIGDGLTNEVLSQEHQYQRRPANVGLRESSRLLGRGRSYGDGPLPTLLRSAVAEDDIAVVVIGSAQAGVDGEFVDPIAAIAASATVLQSAPEALPLAELQSSVGAAAPTRILIVGCHTEHRIHGLATLLRSVYGSAEIAVSAHLVGSGTQEAHYATLRHALPSLGVSVLLDANDAAAFVGLPGVPLGTFGLEPCAIEPTEAREALDDDKRQIVQSLCMHWTRAHLRPLGGGFSGSALFLADGWKGSAKTEPMVVKIDAFSQMRRELDGYHQVKDFLGKHVPTFGYPVRRGESLGVGMELAAMEGRPETLQDTFEAAETEDGLQTFLTRLEKSLGLLADKLYRNTCQTVRVAPFRAFGMHAEQQLTWLRDNAELILSYVDEAGSGAERVNVEQLVQIVRLVARNPDALDSEVCVVHGDLNYANVICDAGDNTWFIDWTHSGVMPIELDFAKLENDVKFVMSKAFDLEDVDRLKKFEDYLLQQPVPADVDGLPDALRFAKWDLRFRRILSAVRRIRQACLSLKTQDDWLAYRVGLLRYATHTLSFDKRRDRGECELPQLLYALYSVDALALSLVADDFHLKVRAERPGDYPERQRISIDEAPWVLECPSYDPPYYVSKPVLAADRTHVEGGWADPEDIAAMTEELAARPSKRRDAEGRPLNPRGRTGIAGRGALGLWGVNLSIAATVVRVNPATGELDVLLGGGEDGGDLELPKGFLIPGEEPAVAVTRVLEAETGWHPGGDVGAAVFEGYTYDQRQTDHAWVESQAYVVVAEEGVPDQFEPAGAFDVVTWWPLDDETVNRVPPGQAAFVRAAAERLREDGRLPAEQAERLLARTG